MRKSQKIPASVIRLALIVAGLSLILVVGMQVQVVEAAPSSQAATNDFCLGCHSQSQMIKTFPNGEVLSLYVDVDKFHDAVHGQEGLNCVDCHEAMAEVPHPQFGAQSVRDAKLELYTVCQKCHLERYNSVLDSVHQKALAGGNLNAAVCTDCHNPHTQTRITDKQTGTILPQARVFIPETCARCHSAIYESYEQTVHGAALRDENNMDVPTCIDCHGVHNIQDPTTAQFRNDTPLLCAKCHTNPNIMDKYGISTDVLDTYVSDFHGTTVTLFEKTDPSLATNKPVCTDCHGVHDIKAVKDPTAGIAIKENLLTKCQRCHPDATANFPDSWMSHYIPSSQAYPVVYFVNLFYKVLIPGVLSGMLFYVLTDVYRRFVHPILFAGKKGDAHNEH